MVELTSEEQRALDILVSQGEQSFLMRYIGQKSETPDGKPRGSSYIFNSYDLDAKTVDVTHLESGNVETVYLRNIRLIDRSTNRR